MTPANESGVDLINDIVNHPTLVLPDVVPIWSRYDTKSKEFVVNWRLLEELRNLGMEPVLYAESGTMLPEDILSRKHDDAFKLLAARARGAKIRIWHESNGGLFHWGKWPIPQMMDIYGQVGMLFGDEGSGLIYCMSHRGKRDDDLLDRYPGQIAVAVVAFDEFRRSDTERLPPQQWAWCAARMATTGRPVWVCETGAEAKTTNRGLFIASIDDAPIVEVVCIFDFRIVFTKPSTGETFVDDWTWNKSMARQWDLLKR